MTTKYSALAPVADDQLINRLKTQKLWLKDEIHRLENETELSKRNT